MGKHIFKYIIYRMIDGETVSVNQNTHAEHLISIQWIKEGKGRTVAVNGIRLGGWYFLACGMYHWARPKLHELPKEEQMRRLING